VSYLVLCHDPEGWTTIRHLSRVNKNLFTIQKTKKQPSAGDELPILIPTSHTYFSYLPLPKPPILIPPSPHSNPKP